MHSSSELKLSPPRKGREEGRKEEGRKEEGRKEEGRKEEGRRRGGRRRGGRRRGGRRRGESTQPHLNNVASQKTKVPLSLPLIIINSLVHDSFCAALFSGGRRGRGRKLVLHWLWQNALSCECSAGESL